MKVSTNLSNEEKEKAILADRIKDGMVICFDCNGTGINEEIDDKCNMCAGEGYVYHKD
jgi:DnaJ-class molecular chaperone